MIKTSARGSRKGIFHRKKCDNSEVSSIRDSKLKISIVDLKYKREKIF